MSWTKSYSDKHERAAEPHISYLISHISCLISHISYLISHIEEAIPVRLVAMT